MQLFLDVGSRPLVVVRLNPDAYTAHDGTRHRGCFAFAGPHKAQLVVRDKDDWSRRSEALAVAVARHTAAAAAAATAVPDKELTIERLFFDGWGA